jgi:hypothetical protein
MSNPDDVSIFPTLEVELPKVIDAVEEYRKIKNVDNLALKAKQVSNEIRSREDLEKHPDVIKEYCRVEQTHVGNIIDAQDYLGSWHLAIIIDEKNGMRSERWLHFLPFSHSKRDERFTDEDSNKIAPAFTNTGLPTDPEKELVTLRDYLAQYKLKKQQEETKKGTQPAKTQPSNATTASSSGPSSGIKSLSATVSAPVPTT